MRDKNTEIRVQEEIDRITSGRASLEELLELAEHGSAYIRANAIEVMVARHTGDARVIPFVEAFVKKEENHRSLMGTISPSQDAIGCLLESGNPKAISAAKALIDAWPDEEREDLDWFLENRRSNR
ncbi:MAG TPA: hypothetical protein VMY42_00425 [Thermoguttaceae bacterium]|nr:hypothetical protein [Thermoguttaceae bacterium]